MARVETVEQETYGRDLPAPRWRRLGAFLALFIAIIWIVPAAVAFGTDTITPLPEPHCLTPAQPCNTITFYYERTDPTPVRGYSVQLQLSNLELCTDVSGSFTELDFLSTHCGGGCTAFKIIDNGGGSYTVDAAILGSNCGPVGSGNLFTLDVRGVADGVGSVEVTSVLARDCNNGTLPALAGPDALLEIDTVGPVAVVDIGAKPEPYDNDEDGTIRLVVKFNAPSEATSLEIYRAPYLGNGLLSAYPEYDDISGSGPPPVPGYPPGPPWELTSVVASGTMDETTVRGLWYHVIFTFDACGNPSPVSNLTDGALNYHLGDVSNGAEAGMGDNSVDVADISLLGAYYGKILSFEDPVNFLDVGPTVAGAIDGRPLTDDLIDFEDLMLFAVNHRAVSATIPGPELSDVHSDTASASIDLVALPGSASGAERVGLFLRNGRGRVQGVHAVLALGGRALLTTEPGDLVDPSVFFKSLEGAETVSLDLAVLGRGATFADDGFLVILNLAGPSRTALRLEEVSLRDSRNHELAFHRLADHSLVPAGRSLSAATAGASAALPHRSGIEVLAVSPNPFQSGTTFSLRVAESGPASFRVFNSLGRLIVQDLRALEPGRHSFFWNGRTARDVPLPSGLYFYEIEMNGRVSRGKLFLAR